MRQILIKTSDELMDTVSPRIKIKSTRENFVLKQGTLLIMPFDVEFVNPFDKDAIGFAPVLAFSLASRGVVLHGCKVENTEDGSFIHIALSPWDKETPIPIKKGDHLITLNLYERVMARKTNLETLNGIIKIGKEQE